MRDYGRTSIAFTVFAVTVVGALTGRAPKNTTNPVFAGCIPSKASATGAIGKCWVGALSGTRVTPDVGARVSVVGARGLRRRAVTTRTRIVGARATVVAVCVDHALGFFADAALTDSGTAAVRLARSAFRGVSVGAALVEIPV